MNRLPKATLWLSVSALAFVANPVSAEENRPPKIKAAAIQVEMIQSDEIKLPAEFQIALYENLIRQLEKQGGLSKSIATVTAEPRAPPTSSSFTARFAASRRAAREPGR